MRKPIIAANWKMNKTASEAETIAEKLVRELGQITSVDIVLCPPFTALATVGAVIRSSMIKLGGQNMFWEEQGAFTGEISGWMLRDLGCDYVIIGHSERRQYFGEDNETVNKRLNKALATGLLPILCIGETLEQREGGQTESVLLKQLKEGLAGIDEEHMKRITIAYEPVWAIGTGKTATPELAEEAHRYIRGTIKGMYSDELSKKIRIQYGGSVKPDNVKALMAQDDLDGALVGGASLKVDSFSRIVKYNSEE